MMRKTLSILFVFALLCAAVTVSAQELTHDRDGNPISIPEQVHSIISLAPAITQVLLDLGMEKALVAVDTYSAQMFELEGIVSMDMMAPDIELIVAISPDVIIASNMTLVNDRDALSYLAGLGCPVAVIPSSDSIDGIIADVQFIGAIVGKAEESEALIQPLKDLIEQLIANVDHPATVYFEIGSTPSLYSFGSGTFLHEMIEIAGGQNIFAAQNGWLAVSEEAVVAAAPDVIFTNETWVDNPVAQILQRPGWESVPAVTNGKVFYIDDNASSQPNHHIVDALVAIAEALR